MKMIHYYQAMELPAMDMGGVSDPYVKVKQKIVVTLATWQHCFSHIL
jgi:hypothetical protein